MAIKNKGLPISSSFPYRGRDSKHCPKNASFIDKAAITSFHSFSMYTEKQIACLLAAKGPISIAVYASKSFLQYSKGIYDDIKDCKPDANPNHSVLLGNLKLFPYFVMFFY
jgi:hypothetical protein